MRARWFIAFSVAAALLVAGCSDSKDSSSDTTNPATSTTGITQSSPKPLKKLEILVTNDDGVKAEGIDVLTKGLRSIEDVHVTVVAPATQESGSGGKTTPGQLKVTDTTTASGYPAKAVAGYPADTVRVAVDEMKLKPDLVVAGVNQGQNLGPVVDISGTVGAARAAVARGIPALSVSEGLVPDIDYQAAMPYVLGWVQDHRLVLINHTQPKQVTNMNIPSCTAGDIKQPIEVPAAPAGTPGAVAAQDCTSTLQDPPNDVVAFNNGYVTITDLVPAQPAR
jgi:5'-nucleotidase